MDAERRTLELEAELSAKDARIAERHPERARQPLSERLMTVAHTARKQHKNVLAFLTACCTAARSGEQVPSSFAA